MMSADRETQAQTLIAQLEKAEPISVAEQVCNGKDGLPMIPPPHTLADVIQFDREREQRGWPDTILLEQLRNDLATLLASPSPLDETTTKDSGAADMAGTAPRVNIQNLTDVDVASIDSVAAFVGVSASQRIRLEAVLNFFREQFGYHVALSQSGASATAQSAALKSTKTITSPASLDRVEVEPSVELTDEPVVEALARKEPT